MSETESEQQPSASSAEASEEKQREREREETWQPKLWSKLIVLVLLVGYGVALVVANDSKVKISFLFASITVSLIWLILLCIVLGLVSGVLVSQMHRHRKVERAKLKEAAELGKQAKS